MHGERASGRAAGVNPGTSREPAAALSPAAFAHPPRTCPGAADKGRRAQPRRRGARPDPGSSGSPRRTPARFTTTPSSFPPGASAAPGGLKPPGPAPTAEGASRVGPGLPSSPRYPQPGSGEPRYLPPPPRSPAGTLPGVRGCPASPLPAPHGSARAAPATGPRAKPAQGTAAEPPQHQVRRAQPALVSARGLPGRVARLPPRPPPPSHSAVSCSFRLTDRLVPSSSLSFSPRPHKFIHILMASGAGLCALCLCSWATRPGWPEGLSEEQMKYLQSQSQVRVVASPDHVVHRSERRHLFASVAHQNRAVYKSSGDGCCEPLSLQEGIAGSQACAAVLPNISHMHL